MSLESMNKFSTVAYGCLQEDRGGRPTMNLVVKNLIESLKIQDEYESGKEKKFKPHRVGLELDDMHKSRGMRKEDKKAVLTSQPLVDDDFKKVSSATSAKMAEIGYERSQHGQGVEIIPLKTSNVLLLHGNLDIWVEGASNLPNMDMFRNKLSQVFGKLHIFSGKSKMMATLKIQVTLM